MEKSWKARAEEEIYGEREITDEKNSEAEQTVPCCPIQLGICWDSDDSNDVIVNPTFEDGGAYGGTCYVLLVYVFICLLYTKRFIFLVKGNTFLKILFSKSRYKFFPSNTQNFFW